MRPMIHRVVSHHRACNVGLFALWQHSLDPPPDLPRVILRLPPYPFEDEKPCQTMKVYTNE